MPDSQYPDAQGAPPITRLPSAIAYADSSEAALLERFSRAQAFDEYAVLPSRTPWPLYYHLSPRRKSLLSWMDFGPHADILELGAGCGALTSLLVERARAVTAVEGSPQRANVIQQRCRKAENLRIVVGDNAELPYRGEFSHATLIGVLEYAGAYVKNSRPYAHMLARAADYLRPDGCLVLAIENAMGHKYLAGLPEDHTGRPYCGVNGYPGPFGVRTFDQPTLAAMLAEAGFAAQAWFYPSPDYKIPDSVLSEAAFHVPGLNPLSLLDLPSRDFDNNHFPAFNERAFLASALKAGIAQHFMNSFLVLAAKTKDAPALEANASMLAAAPNADGCPRIFQTQTRFDMQPDASVQVRRANLHGLAPALFATGEQRLKAKEKFLPGYENFLERILRLLDAGDQASAGQALIDWIELVSRRAKPAAAGDAAAFAAFCHSRLGRPIYEMSMDGPFVPGALLDAHPGNVLTHPQTGDVRFIDLEWRLYCNLPLQLLIDRGVNLVGQKIAPWRRYYCFESPAAAGLPPEMERRLSRNEIFRKADLASLALFQAWFTAGVRSGNLDHRQDEPVTP